MASRKGIVMERYSPKDNQHSIDLNELCIVGKRGSLAIELVVDSFEPSVRVQTGIQS